MKTLTHIFLWTAIALSMVLPGAYAAKPVAEATPIAVPIPKGAVHIVANAGDEDFKKVFTYFPYPPLPMDARNRVLSLRREGVYRIEVTPEGKVAAVTILKSSGRSMDYAALKTFNRWKAKPGPLRVVDVTFTLTVWGKSRRTYP
jgi:TonB family protein